MRRLLEAVEIIQHYDSFIATTKQILNDIEELKKTLIQVISMSHLLKPSEITNNQYLSCRNFLKHFDEGKIYTFNYDLILYWVFMHFMDSDTLKMKCNNGFSYLHSEEFLPEDERDKSLHWEIGREHQQRLYYIDGAMHIFSYGVDIEKLSYADIGVPLAKQVKLSVAKNKFPVFISEGTGVFQDSWHYLP